MPLLASSRKMERYVIRACEVGDRVATWQACEDEGFGPWVNPKIFAMPGITLHVSTHPWFPPVPRRER